MGKSTNIHYFNGHGFNSYVWHNQAGYVVLEGNPTWKDDHPSDSKFMQRPGCFMQAVNHSSQRFFRLAISVYFKSVQVG